MRARAIAGIASLAAILSSNRGPQISQPFELNSFGSDYPFVARLTGTTMERGDTLFIDVSDGTVASQIPSNLGDQGKATEIGIAFGLGSQNGDGWKFKHDTPPQPVAASLNPQEQHKISSLHFFIVGLDTIPAADRWLVAQILVRQHLPSIQPGFLASYACAETNLRGSTRQSDARAARMKAQYAQTC